MPAILEDKGKCTFGNPEKQDSDKKQPIRGTPSLSEHFGQRRRFPFARLARSPSVSQISFNSAFKFNAGSPRSHSTMVLAALASAMIAPAEPECTSFN